MVIRQRSHVVIILVTEFILVPDPHFIYPALDTHAYTPWHEQLIYKRGLVPDIPSGYGYYRAGSAWEDWFFGGYGAGREDPEPCWSVVGVGYGGWS